MPGLLAIPARGVHELVAVSDDFAGAGMKFMLVSPQAVVARMFTLTSLGQFVPVHRHLAEALLVTDRLDTFDPGDPAPCG